jgi:shikimate O-hydroxycinnamoyltransferase
MFYTFAGNTSVLCDDSGALFIQARVRANLSEAIQNGASEKLNQYIAIEPYDSGESNDTRRNIPFVVKISFFDCGGMAIGACMSHKVGDFSSLATFMNVWAAVQRGETEIIGQPNLDLGCHYFPPLEDIQQADWSLRNKLMLRRFVFDKEKIAEIKELISSASNSQVQNPSRVVAVSAFIWKHIIDVVRAKDATKTMFPLSQAVNLRSRMCPVLPETSIGNVFVMTFGIISKEMSYHGLAKDVRNQIRQIDHEYIKVIQSGSIFYNAFREAMESFLQPDSGLCYFSSWCNFPLYQLDYGWGKPLSVCPVGMPVKNGAYLMDTRSGDGIEAWISMVENELAMLPSEFLSLQSNDL